MCDGDDDDGGDNQDDTSSPSWPFSISLLWAPPLPDQSARPEGGSEGAQEADELGHHGQSPPAPEASQRHCTGHLANGLAPWGLPLGLQLWSAWGISVRAEPHMVSFTYSFCPKDVKQSQRAIAFPEGRALICKMGIKLRLISENKPVRVELRANAGTAIMALVSCVRTCMCVMHACVCVNAYVCVSLCACVHVCVGASIPRRHGSMLRER